MTHRQAIDILELLMEGINPVTGEILPENMLSEPDVILAIRSAIRALRVAAENERKAIEENDLCEQHFTKKGTRDAGRPWTAEDDQRLKKLYEKHVSIDDMCAILQRRPRGLNNRMIFLGLVQPEVNRYSRPLTPGMERAGMPWFSEEDQKLQELFNQQKPLREIATTLHRSERSIEFRMERLQLIDNAEDYPESVRNSTRRDNDDLRQRYLSGQSVEDIAACYQIPEKAIRARLFYMGLSMESPISIAKTK